jgi:23S rRNA (guanine745-N1)-methyltransferase
MDYQNKFMKLTCPIDDFSLEIVDSSLKCKCNHCFDISKQGYVNLLPVQYKKSKNPGDSREMVLARSEFLSSGLYQPIADMLVDILGGMTNDRPENFIVDAGCGEGYYLDYVYSRLGCQNLSYIGLDISKEAVVFAARRNKMITWLVASNKNLPIISDSADTVLCQFGFPFYDEFKRILKPNGKIILVDTGKNHLIELRKIIYSEVRESDLPSISEGEKNGFKLLESKKLTYKDHLTSNQQIMNLLSMTPHLFRATAEGKIAVQKLAETEITVDVSFRVLGL